MSQILKFNDHRFVANRDIVPDHRNHHVTPIVQPRTYDAEPETDSFFGLVSAGGSQLVHVSRTEDELQRLGCFQSSWDEVYVTEFLQDKLDALSEDHDCWLKKGVAGLKVSLERNVTATLILDITLPACPVNITSAGNTFSIDFSTETYKVNGVSAFDLVLLTSIHLACMTLAFFVVYPIILVFSSAIVLCELIDRPLYQKRIEKWQATLYLVFFIPLLVAGMACGIAGMGTSNHFRTEHGIIGLATVILATIAVCLYFVEKRIGGWVFMHGRWHWTRKIISYVDMFVCQTILLVSGFALPDGIDDFGVMSLCGTNMISTSLAFSIGMIVAFIWNGAMAAMAVQWWLVRRASPDQPQSRIKMWVLKIFRQPS
ncbi:hypothetical protein DL767_000066 [Monosporascus sp. MG133]|nr:hypothetical protein DL767_000066 [Monosporascus sp. MG133]